MLQYLTSTMTSGRDHLSPPTAGNHGDAVKLPHFERHSQNLHQRRETHYLHAPADDSVLYWGSPLSPALWLMVVALSEEVWHRTFQTTLSTMGLTSRLLRYVDGRLCLVDPHWLDDPAFATFLHPEFYGAPHHFGD